VHLSYVNGVGKYQLDSCLLKKGYFEFTGKINEPTIADFYGRTRSDRANFTDFYIEPTTIQAVFTADHFKDARINGSKSQDEYALYLKQIKLFDARWKPVLDALNLAREKKDSITESEIRSKQIPLYIKGNDSVILNFIRQNPQSFVSANLLKYQTQTLPLDSLKNFFGRLSSPVRGSRTGKFINEFIVKAEGLLIGKNAPDFSQKDKDGRTVSLKDFAGKYILLDFWASWCVPCREEHPFLKKAYEKYQSKDFTIISISLDRVEDKDKWLTAIKKDGLVWTQLCDFKGWNGEVVNLYNLFGRGIPSNFLINPQGKIIARDLRGKQLENKLAEVVN